LADGREGFVALKEVGVGDQIVVLTGERIPLDGVVIEGEGCCDESLMTGEAIPVDKKVGSLVMGGSFLQQGMICYEVVSEPDQSLLHQILQTIQQNIGQKAIYTRAADRIAHWFVPFVLLIAIGAAFFTFFFVIEDSGKGVVETAIMRAISILLISCPCAIGIAAPLAESQLLNGLASMGAIVRNRGSLQYLGREDFIVFDKTGTLTEGKFIVRHGLEELTEDQLSALKGLASKSTHPISSAIASRIEYPPLQFSKIEEFPGLGLRGFQGSDSYLLGSADFIGEGGIEENSFTTVYFVCNGVTLAKLYLSDTIKAGISQLLAALRPAEALLLSGDCKNAVEHAAKQCGFTQWKWGCHPSQKREAVADLKKEGHIVAMVGDGINDAPALTQADIGISVVNATDISIQVSDIILTTDNFAVIPKMRDLAILARRIMKQNLFWAFFYNGLGIGLAIFGLLTPIFAAFAMVASSIMVLLNAQRIKVK
jgi:heavy metal translocating P-type ATPase